MKHALVIVTWEDSSIGHHGWQTIADAKKDKPAIVQIVSAGWIVRKTKRGMTLAQNVGGLDGKATGQVSNLIHIPASCTLSVEEIIPK